MSLQLSGKQKAARVDLQYHRRSTPVRRWIQRLLVVAALLTVGIAVLAVVGPVRRRMSSPGDLHAVHAAWDNDCEKCHVPGRPTDSGNALTRWLAKPALSEERCQQCHEGPPHSSSQDPDQVPRCGTCHRDHAGRTAWLTQLSDHTCQRCHAIDSFAKNHPPFRVTDADGVRDTLSPTSVDPGKLIFNHQVHLSKGLLYNGNSGRPFTLDAIRDDTLREKYRAFAGENGVLTLGCIACHSSDAEGDPASVRTAGDVMLPVNFDRHCKACHPLRYDAALPELPHRVQPQQVHDLIWGAVANQKTKEAPMPRVRPLAGHPQSRAEEEARRSIDRQAGGADQFLASDQRDRRREYVLEGKSTCALCHTYSGPVKGGEPLPTITPTAIPTHWFPKSTFNHTSHRTLNCVECHQGVTSSTMASDILMPQKDNCIQCHGPSKGVRSSCTTCHLYHNGDNPLHGLGSPARDARKKRTIRDW